MLTAMLQTIDDLHVYDRSTGMRPCLLLDGHHSRMKLPFLKYINNPDPYGTHIWQVADASELNGCFKMALTKAKRYYLSFRDEKKFVPSDIIALVNIAFPQSFGKKENARKAILKRGWNPLNYVLLDHPKLIRTDSRRINPNR
jgi:hypothetical protein